MKTKLWIYWWWVRGGMHDNIPWLRFTYSSRRKSASALQQDERDNGWRVGRVHRQQITMEDPPK